MAYHVFFSFSQGLSAPLDAPKGTLQAILRHVAEVEAALGVTATRYKDNSPHWLYAQLDEAIGRMDSEALCSLAENHNDWVRRLYKNFGLWSKDPVADGEQITSDDAMKFWQALVPIKVPFSKWTQDYYISRMEHLYSVMRGRESEGVSFDEKPLSIKQADNIIRIFEQELSPFHVELQVPTGGYDELFEGDDCAWCERCGSVLADDISSRLASCRKRRCPLRETYGDEED